jgi:hypothetical protein
MENCELADQLELQDVVEPSKEAVVGWDSIFSGLRKERFLRRPPPTILVESLPFGQ